MPAALLNPDDFSAPGMVGTGTNQGLSQALDIGVNATQSASQIMLDHLAKQAQLTGALAGSKAGNQRDPDTGRLLPITSLPDDVSYYSTAYRDAAISSYTNNAVNDFRAQSDELKRENFDNPDKYRTLINAYQTETIKGLDPRVLGSVLPHFTEISNGAYSAIADVTSKATIDSAAKGTLQLLDSAVGDIQNKLTSLGYTKDTPGVIDLAIKDLFQPGWDRLKGIDGNTYNDGWAAGQERQVRQQLMTSALVAEAQHQGQTLTTIDAHGNVKVDEDAYSRWASGLYNDPVLAGYFKGKELDGAVSAAHAAFTLASDGRKNDLDKVNVAADAQIADNVAKLNGGKIKVMQDLHDYGDAKTSEIMDLVTQASKLTWDRDPAKNGQKLDSWINDLMKSSGDILNNPAAMESARVYAASVEAQTTGTPYNMKMSGVSDGNIKTAILRRERDYDRMIAADTGNPNMILSAQNDPQLTEKYLFDPKQGVIATTGGLTPRIQGELSMPLDRIPLQNANNIAKLYHDLVDKYPMIADSLPDAQANVAAWEAAQHDPDVYAKLRSQGQGALPRDQRDDAMAKIDNNAKTDPTYATNSIRGGIVDAMNGSDPLQTIWKNATGQPPDSNASIIPNGLKQGAMSIVTNMFPVLGLATGNIGPQTLWIYADPQTQRDFLEAKKASAAKWGADEEKTNASAVQNLYQNENAMPSRLLMPPPDADKDNPSPSRDFSGFWTYGPNAPEPIFNASYWDIAFDASHFVAGLAKRDSIGQQEGEAGRGIWSFVWNNEYPPGDPNHWSWEAAYGRLRLDPVKGFDPSHPRYNVMGLVKDGTGIYWKILNPNDPYTFDRKRTDSYSLEDMKEARATALRARGLVPGGDTSQPGLFGTSPRVSAAPGAGAVLGKLAGTGITTAGSALSAMQEHVEKGNELSVTGLFDRLMLAGKR